MISQKQFVKKLRELGYSFKGRTKSERNEKYRKSGSTHFVMLPRQDLLSELWVRSTLKMCGVSPAEIELFINGGKEDASNQRK